MAHSPTPWPMPIYDNHGNGGFSEWWEIPSIAKVYTAADAEFIFSAANCHDELVAALKRLSSTWGCFAGCLAALSKLGECSDHNYSCKVARAALAKAEAK